MDIAKGNNKYIEMKNKLEGIENKINSLEKQIQDAINQRNELKEQLKQSNIDQEEVLGNISKLDRSIERMTKQKKSLDKKKIKLDVKLGKILGKVGKDSDDISKLEEYNRGNIENWESENENLEQEKNKMEKVKQILENNPSLLETVNKLKSAENDKKNLEHWKDTNNVNMTDYNQRMEKTEKLIAERRKEINNYIATKHLDISLDDIPEFSIKESLMEKLSNEIESRDEQISDNKSYISEARGVITDIENRSVNVNIDTVEEEKNEQIDNKPKWYQFAQRFKNWNDRKNVPALDAPKNEQQLSNGNSKATNSFLEDLKKNVNTSNEQTANTSNEQTIDISNEQTVNASNAQTVDISNEQTENTSNAQTEEKKQTDVVAFSDRNKVYDNMEHINNFLEGLKVKVDEDDVIALSDRNEVYKNMEYIEKYAHDEEQEDIFTDR